MDLLPMIDAIPEWTLEDVMFILVHGENPDGDGYELGSGVVEVEGT